MSQIIAKDKILSETHGQDQENLKMIGRGRNKVNYKVLMQNYQVISSLKSKVRKVEEK